MPTYDFTGDGNGVNPSESFRKSVMLKRAVNAAAIIASDTTLTTNGVIAAADIIQIIDMPAGFVMTDVFVKAVTVQVGTHTADIGVAGSNEAFSNYDLTTAAPTISVMAVGAGWGTDTVTAYGFSTADTLDMVFDHETDGVGEWNIYIAGWFLD